MRKLSIKARMYLNLGVLAVALAVVCGMGLRSAGQIAERMEDVYGQHLVPMAQVNEIYQRSLQSQQYRLEAYVHQDPAFTAQNSDAIKRNRDRINQLMESFMQTDLTPEEITLAHEMKEQRAALVGIGRQEMDALLASDYETAKQVRVRELEPVVDRMDATTEKLGQRRHQLADELISMSRKEIATLRVTLLSSFGAALLIAGVFGWLLTRYIGRGLWQAQSVAQRISRGELGQSLDIRGGDELAQLLHALQGMDHKLVDIVSKVRRGADAVQSASQQLSQGNDDLSQRTQEQASALEETASSMEEMTATVKQNADNARQANQLAIRARGQAGQGGAVVGQAVDAMNEITASSRKIADIIGVIDEIAFQTNLLALNAAVEAARAGEQGRGFAVVASEVRSLAQRSAGAAREIKQLIGDSVEKVKTGSRLVDESGATLSEIVDGVKRVTDIVAEIAAASDEQSSGIDQINNAVAQMDGTTQQNAALVEEASAASKALQHQAEDLKRLVAFFHIGAPTHPGNYGMAAAEPVPMRPDRVLPAEVVTAEAA